MNLLYRGMNPDFFLQINISLGRGLAIQGREI
jgi:hypothetical protein